MCDKLPSKFIDRLKACVQFDCLRTCRLKDCLIDDLLPLLLTDFIKACVIDWLPLHKWMIDFVKECVIDWLPDGLYGWFASGLHSTFVNNSLYKGVCEFLSVWGPLWLIDSIKTCEIDWLPEFLCNWLPERLWLIETVYGPSWLTGRKPMLLISLSNAFVIESAID